MHRVLASIAAIALLACGELGGSREASDEPTRGETVQAQTQPPPPPPDDPRRLPRKLLMDPATCQGCHPKHYEEWASSMHAYASIDPVFVAMNQRGQRATEGKMGKFCVQCHAPMAVREGLTTDGLNLAELPRWAQGVTCYFCHTANGYGEDHFNANITLANDQTMRGSYSDAVDPIVHGVARSELFDRNSMKSSIACGACHDIVNDNGVHIERTLKEYKESVFSIERSGKQGGDSCQGCHMAAKRDADYIANMPGMNLQKRAVHKHRWAAVDVALTDDFPGQEAFRRATECELADAVRVTAVTEVRPGEFRVDLETDAGHRMPSGAAQDRRLWLEFVAYDANDKVIFQSGKIADGEVEEHPPESDKYDPSLCMMRDRMIDKDGKETHMFWEAAQPSQTKLLPPLTNINTTHVLSCDRYRIPGRQTPARVEVRLRMRPMGMDVLQDLVDSGDLDPKFMARVPTFTLHATEVEWRRETPSQLRPLAPNWSRKNCAE